MFTSEGNSVASLERRRGLRDQTDRETTAWRTLAVVPIHSEVNRLADPSRGSPKQPRILAAGYLRLRYPGRGRSPLDTPEKSSPHVHEVDASKKGELRGRND